VTDTPQGETLFGRKWKLSVGTPAGTTAMDLSLLDFEFAVEETLWFPPTKARIKIWNVGDNIISRLNKELTQVLLEAGYQSPSKQYGQVFAGQIAYFKAGRQDAVDKYVEIWAATYDTAVNAAVVNTWLQAGWVTEDAINAVLSAMLPFGVTLGQLPDDLDKSKKPRGRLMFGMARDFLRDIERTEKGHFFIDQQGKLHFLRDDEALKVRNETIPILNKKTGLIGVPTTTLDGAVEAQCLLNPSIHAGSRVKINDKDTISKYTDVGSQQLISDAYRLSMTEFNFKPDGIYTVGHVRHQWQTRGNPWYSSFTTQRVDQQPGLGTSAS
jgi:hypothetical protein